jgi:catechol 2,3-dioxygenase-like lactoylglutathione lyase family enzyme
MDYPVTGIHHLTACVGGAQEDIDFFTKVVGQRLIKQTILFDGRYVHYHFYYANGKAEPGTVMSTFPYKGVTPGGFARDEAFNQLGRQLLLPPWFEQRRTEILSMLEPIRVPDGYGPVAESASTAASRCTDATFINEETEALTT